MKPRPAMYQRPAKPLTLPARKRGATEAPELPELPEIVAVDRATECHVTPDDVARRMVGYPGPQGDYLTLEPSAGTGQLARALLASGHSPYELTMVGRHHQLASIAGKIGPTIQGCFLKYAAGIRGRAEFPRVIMNPPFSAVRQHVAAAVSLLGRGGHDRADLVALVPLTYDHPDAVTLENLPDDTFASARVRTRIIRISR